MNSGQRCATTESVFPYALHAIADSNRGQILAIIESVIPYTLHAIADSNRGQILAFIESPIPYARHTIGDSNRGQILAIIESGIPYTLHAVGKCYVCQFIVCAKSFFIYGCHIRCEYKGSKTFFRRIGVRKNYRPSEHIAILESKNGIVGGDVIDSVGGDITWNTIWMLNLVIHIIIIRLNIFLAT